jgi:hypothetical protein
LPSLRRVYAIKADFVLSVGCVEDGDRVGIGNAYELAPYFVGYGKGCEEESQQCGVEGFMYDSRNTDVRCFWQYASYFLNSEVDQWIKYSHLSSWIH